MSTQTKLNDFEVVMTMKSMGGEFAKQLATLYLHADCDNRERIRTAWPELWHSFADLAEHVREELGPKWWEGAQP